jgi:hypothetical protein
MFSKDHLTIKNILRGEGLKGLNQSSMQGIWNTVL